MRRFHQRVPDVVTLLIVVLSAIWYYKTNIQRQITGLAGPSDFSEYYRAARAVLSGMSPYENPAWFYPPLAAFLLAPFALTDYVTARWIWFVVCHAFLVAAGYLLWRTPGRDHVALCCVACVWAFGGATEETFVNGQISPVLVLILVLAYTKQGIAAGIGFALKYLPGVLVIALLLNRSRRAIAAFVSVIVLGMLIPYAVLIVGFTGPKAPPKGNYWMGTPATYNWSIPAILLRALDPPVRRANLPYNWEFGNVAKDLHPLPRAQQLLSFSTAVAVFLAGVLVLTRRCRGRLKDRHVPWAMAALMSLTLAAVPVSWYHYQLLQYPGLALLLAAAIHERAWGITACVAICAALLNPIPVAALVAYRDQHGGWTAASPATLYIWTSVAPLACLGVFALCLRNIRRYEPPSP